MVEQAEFETEVSKGKDRDYWVGETRIINGREVWWGKYFVHHGVKWGVNGKTGETICLGRVAESPQDAPQTALPLKKVVSKPRDKEIIPQRRVAGVFAQPPDNNQGGRPAVILPVEKIKDMRSSGKSVTAITDWLNEQGIVASRRTVYNVLKGQTILL